MRLLIALGVLAALVTTTGCSLSKSSKSISDSISSPSKSSSESSGGDDDSGEPETPQDQASYEKDVAQLAATYATNGGDIGAFRSAVAQLAAKRGITNWETDPNTCQAIGRGVGTAGMDQTEFKAFSKNLFGEDLAKQSELAAGYAQTGPAPPAPASNAPSSGAASPEQGS